MTNFKKSVFAIAAFALLASGVALAQYSAPLVTGINPTDDVQIIPNGTPAPGNIYATVKQLQGWIFGGNIIRSAEKPVLSACITGGGTIAGTDNAFVLTGGSTASTSCVATFTTAYITRPVCSVSSETAPGTTTPSFAVSTTAVTITQASESSEVYDVICVAQPGG